MLDELSILIVTWNGDDYLSNCLTSLRSVCDAGAEVVVVDNAASTATRNIVSQFTNCRYVSTDRNVGFAGGNNIGIKHCTRKYVALLNNDTLVHDEPFSCLISFLKDHPDVGIVQGTLILPTVHGTLDTCGTLMTSIGKLHLCHFMEPPEAANLCPMPVFSTKGALMLFERNLLQRTNGVLFHDHFFNNYEETDFCHRVWLVGKKVYFVPTAPVEHLYNATIKRLPALEVRAHELANMIFSLHTLLGTYGKMRLLPFFYAYRILMIIRDMAGGSFDSLRMFAQVIKMVHANRKLLAGTRRQIQESRIITDRELLRQITYHPSTGYWLKQMKTWLSGRY